MAASRDAASRASATPTSASSSTSRASSRTSGMRSTKASSWKCFRCRSSEALEWVRQGRITEAKAVTGLLWADKIARGEWS